MNRRFLHALLIALILPAGAAVRSQTPDPPPEKPADIYDAKADAKAQINQALDTAKRHNKRVLVEFGANWCHWCHKLHAVFSKAETVAPVIRGEYLVVPVDVGKWDKNLDLVKAYEADIENYGLPFLTVLDADGKVLVNQNTGDLEDGQRHDLAKVEAFLKKWAAPPLDAENVLFESLARGAKEKKLVLLHVGAPWCGWCTRLDKFLEKHWALFEADYLDVPIDLDRMLHGQEVVKQLRKSDEGGIPWIAILDGQGNTLITSDGPDGNVGYPYEPAEIDHFLMMLKKTATRLSSDQLGQIETALRQAAKPRLPEPGK